MIKLKRRAMLKTLGGFSIGGLIPVFAESPRNHITGNKAKNIETDVLVIGGGTAGVVAAIQAARAGCSTIIVENGSQLGGTMTTGGVSFPGLFYAWGKQVIGGIGWDLVRETVRMNDDELPDFSIPFGTNHPKHHVRINGYVYALLAEEKCQKEGVTLRYYETPVSILPSKNGWEVETIGKGTHARIFCKQLIDCTGNAFAASMAGFKLLREEETQPGSLMFRLEGYDLESLDLNRIQEQYDRALQSGELKQGDASIGIKHMLIKRGDNAQHIFGADSSTSERHSLTNIEGRASLLRMLRFLRNMPGC
ncbi:MAG: FAD-dependent oxidoreductase, partial [Bacteroidales bacterium]